jgi:S-adenosylmethionine synthetase
LAWLRPDGKSQVTVEYVDGEPRRVVTIVLSTQHAPELESKEITDAVIERVIRPTIPDHLLDERTNYYVNPTGRFVIGGPYGDSGLTGRKIIVDSYGGLARHGGGAFSGKDPTKVDRSAAYMARYVAKNIVTAGLAEKAMVQFAYAIGVTQPVAIDIETYGTNTIDPAQIEARVRKAYDLSPAGIIKHLGLLDMKFLPTAKNGHFGNPEFPWEHTGAADVLSS